MRLRPRTEAGRFSNRASCSWIGSSTSSGRGTRRVGRASARPTDACGATRWASHLAMFDPPYETSEDVLRDPRQQVGQLDASTGLYADECRTVLDTETFNYRADMFADPKIIGCRIIMWLMELLEVRIAQFRDQLRHRVGRMQIATGPNELEKELVRVGQAHDPAIGALE